MAQELALFGGPKTVTVDTAAANRWPPFGKEEGEAVARLVTEGDVTYSPRIRDFESKFADYVGVRFALACNNGTSALHSALFGLKLRPGDEVLCPVYTYWASAMPALWVGAVPVFCEVAEDTLNIDPEDVERRITGRTRAIMAVHLWGLPCDMKALWRVARKHRLAIIEDASHAHGASYGSKKVGNLTEVAGFSFQASKVMPVGEGGIVTTNSREVYELAAALGHYERIAELRPPLNAFGNNCFGFKYRASPLATTLGELMLRKLDRLNARRNENVEFVNEALAKLGVILPMATSPEMCRVYYGNTVRFNPEGACGLNRDQFAEAMSAEGAGVGAPRYKLLTETAPFRDRWLYEDGGPLAFLRVDRPPVEHGEFPQTRRALDSSLSLPTFPFATRMYLRQFIRAAEKVLANAGKILARTDRPEKKA